MVHELSVFRHVGEVIASDRMVISLTARIFIK